MRLVALVAMTISSPALARTSSSEKRARASAVLYVAGGIVGPSNSLSSAIGGNHYRIEPHNCMCYWQGHLRVLQAPKRLVPLDCSVSFQDPTRFRPAR